jgi:hypothetical protein
MNQISSWSNDSGETAELGKRILSTLDGTGEVLRKTVVEDDLGGADETWAVSTSDVRCAIVGATGSGNERVALDKLTAYAYFVLTVPKETDLLEVDRFRTLGVTFEVNSVNAPVTIDAIRFAKLSLAQ